MNIRRFVVALIAIFLFIFSGCGISSEQPSSSPKSSIIDDTSSEQPSSFSESSTTDDSSNFIEDSSASQSQDGQSLPPNTPRPDIPPPDSAPQGSFGSSSSTGQILEPPPVPSGEQLEGLDFSTMEKDDLVTLLQPVLERAKYFCRFATLTGMENIEIDYNLEEAILRPFRNYDEYYFHPYTNLPYRTVEELKEDMCTVFTPDNMEDENILGRYVFEHLTDYDGKIYFTSGFGEGFTMERRWELDGLEIASAEKSKLTISAPVSWGPYQNSITAPLNFETKNGYIVMDESYFAVSVKDKIIDIN